MRFLFTFLLCFFSSLTWGQPLSHYMDKAMQTMLSWRNDTTGVWENAGWWNSANVLTAALRYSAVVDDRSIEDLAEDVFQKARHYRLGTDTDGNDLYCDDFNNDYFDDQGWWALAWVEAYKLTREEKYLDMAETIYSSMSTGWDSYLSGGLYWRRNPLEYKNAIANNLYALLCARLYKLTKKEKYRSRFLESSDWMLDSGMINRTNWQVEDGLNKNGRPNSGQYYTYNQGVALAALTERYELTKDTLYLAMAEHIADATMKLMTTEDGILKELKQATEPSADGVQFKGIFIRHLAYLYQVDKQERYREFILKNAESIVANDYDPVSKSFGCYWYGPFHKVQPAANSCALECVIEAVNLQDRVNDHTSFQSSHPWNELMDNRADIVMVYGVGGNPFDVISDNAIEKRIRSWKERGYETQFMTGIAWGGYQDYFTGEWDGKSHLDEGQVEMKGDTIWHGKMVPYIVPSLNFLKYMKEVHIKRVIDAGIDVIYLEEPEFWARAGYSESFKKEWEAYYGFPWRAQHESAENTYLSNKLKYYLYYRALEEVFTFAKEYGKSLGRDIKCYVPTHSLINYSQWEIVSPEASLASLPCVDGYIAQVWTGTSRVPNYFKGERKERVFENAFLEYGCLESMTKPTGRRVYFLTDPIEDATHDWEDYKRNYEATFTAELLYPDNNYFEVMPWPERIYMKLYPKSANSTEEDYIPRDYSTQMQVMIGSLNKMPCSKNRVSGPQGIYVMMANSLMFQRTAEPMEGYEDPQLANFHGLALPLLKRGVPVQIMHLENTGYEENWKDAKVVLMTYSNMKPLQPEVHQHIADWVKEGGVLVYVGRDKDPFQNVQEWWNQDGKEYDHPADHLFQLMRIPAFPSEGKYRYGKGRVHVIRKDPKEFVMDRSDTQLLVTVRDAYEEDAHAGQLEFKNYLSLQRGCYEIIAVMDESVSDEPLRKVGLFIDLFDPELPVLEYKRINPGQQAYLINLDRVRNDGTPQVLASAGREYDETWDGDTYSFISKAPKNTTNVMRILLPYRPSEVFIDGQEQPLDWNEKSHTLRVKFENSPEGIKVVIK